LIATKGLSRRGLARWIASARVPCRCGFAGNEHGGAGRRHRIDGAIDRLHRQRRTDDAVIAVAAVIVLQGFDDPFQRGMGGDVAHRHHQPVLGERLDQEIPRAVLHRLDRDVDRTVRGDHHAGAGQFLRLDDLQDLEPADVGQMDVQQHHVGQIGADRGQRRLAGFGDRHRIAAAVEKGRVHLGHRGRILDDQHLRSALQSHPVPTTPARRTSR
jgi:hypothetical protein